MKRAAVCLALALGVLGRNHAAGCPPRADTSDNAAQSTTAAVDSSDPQPDDVRSALGRALDFLLRSQNPDGSWGGSNVSLTTWSGDIWSNPESHRAWRVATSGLCCLALLEAGNDVPPEASLTPATQTATSLPHGDPATVRAAIDRALTYLIANAQVKRPNEWDTMGCWAWIYDLQALAAAYADPRFADAPRRADLRRAAQTCLEQLAYNQSLAGGWGYLEFDEPRTARPQWATSFTTAAGVVALADARAAGLSVDPDMLRRAVWAVRRCRLPSGAYTYAVQVIPSPGRSTSVNAIKGSLSRIQSCNLALWLTENPAQHARAELPDRPAPAGAHVVAASQSAEPEITPARLRAGLDQFFREHRFLDIALQRPVPHEAYYQNSGYFYLFGHYYAARVIAQLPPADRAAYWPRLQHELLKLQRPDGSVWDYDHHGYAKPYGTAYTILALHESLR